MYEQITDAQQEAQLSPRHRVSAAHYTAAIEQPTDRDPEKRHCVRTL